MPTAEALRVQRREYSRQYREMNPETNRERQRRYYEANREQVKARVRAYNQRQRTADRAAVFAHYGQLCACPGCGMADNLTIDHVDGDGTAHRKELFGRKIGGGHQFYRWLVKNGFPSGLQTLCVRCNGSKGTGPTCRLDHNAERMAA